MRLELCLLVALAMAGRLHSEPIGFPILGHHHLDGADQTEFEVEGYTTIIDLASEGIGHEAIDAVTCILRSEHPRKLTQEPALKEQVRWCPRGEEDFISALFEGSLKKPVYMECSWHWVSCFASDSQQYTTLPREHYTVKESVRDS